MKQKIKEMIYKSNLERDILLEGNFKGYHYLIVSYGTHPCAYVELKDNEYELYPSDKKWFELVDVHGGITYTGNLHHLLENTNKHFIGWDYAHCEDYVGYFGDDKAFTEFKKYTVKDIMKDVKKVINQLKSGLL